VHFLKILLIVFKWFEDHLTKLNTTFQDTLQARSAATDKRLDEVNKRITDLDNYFEEQKKAILKYIDDRGSELSALLNKFRVRPLLLQWALNSMC
jgi:hypothetical protein